jgi:hypothetical protein
MPEREGEREGRNEKEGMREEGGSEYEKSGRKVRNEGL